MQEICNSGTWRAMTPVCVTGSHAGRRALRRLAGQLRGTDLRSCAPRNAGFR